MFDLMTAITAAITAATTTIATAAVTETARVLTREEEQGIPPAYQGITRIPIIIKMIQQQYMDKILCSLKIVILASHPPHRPPVHRDRHDNRDNSSSILTTLSRWRLYMVLTQPCIHHPSRTIEVSIPEGFPPLTPSLAPIPTTTTATSSNREGTGSYTSLLKCSSQKRTSLRKVCLVTLTVMPPPSMMMMLMLRIRPLTIISTVALLQRTRCPPDIAATPLWFLSPTASRSKSCQSPEPTRSDHSSNSNSNSNNPKGMVM